LNLLIKLIGFERNSAIHVSIRCSKKFVPTSTFIKSTTWKKVFDQKTFQCWVQPLEKTPQELWLILFSGKFVS
jgi:hypothetical protein